MDRGRARQEELTKAQADAVLVLEALLGVLLLAPELADPALVEGALVEGALVEGALVEGALVEGALVVDDVVVVAGVDAELSPLLADDA